MRTRPSRRRGRSHDGPSDRGLQAVRLSRDGRAAPPVRLVHLGLGNFFRAHAAWYTDRTRPTSGGSRRSRAARAARVAADLNAQDGLYTLVSRGADRDRFEVVGSLARAHTADEHEAWLRYFADSGGGRGDDHRDRGRLSARRRRRARRGAPRGAPRTSRRCGATRPRSCARRRRGCSPGSPRAGAPTPGRSPSCRATTSRATARSCSASCATPPSSPTRPRSTGSTSPCRS